MWVPTLGMQELGSEPHSRAEIDGVCCVRGASEGLSPVGTRMWHMGLALPRLQVSMETSRQDAEPINSQFKVIFLKEGFFMCLEQVSTVFLAFLLSSG